MRLFRRSAIPSPSLPSSGHAGDDLLLAEIAARSDLEAPRHWVHYLYLDDETQARGAARVVASAGWVVQEVDVAADGGSSWVVVAEREAAVTTPETVREARRFFEGVAATHGAGDYDGWEASV